MIDLIVTLTEYTDGGLNVPILPILRTKDHTGSRFDLGDHTYEIIYACV